MSRAEDPQVEHRELAPSVDDDVLDVQGAMALLRIGRNTVYRLCAENKIPHRRIGGAEGRRGEIRFSRAALLRWLEGER